MNNKAFMEMTRRRMDRCLKVLDPKEREYARGGDRFHNFRRAGEILARTPEDALLGMAVKHLTSIMDMAKDAGSGVFIDPKQLDEKFNDIHNYLFLLEGLLQERIEKQFWLSASK
jgi:hypothetical protein